MKKFAFIFLAAAAMLAACSKVSETRDAEQRPISFQVARYSLTKADPADYKTDYQNVPFGAYAWYKGVSAADNANFMTNQKVSWNAGESAWLPEGSTYYWPKSGTLDFVCYSPYSTDTQMIAIAEDKVAFSAYTPDQDDLMYADKAVGLNDNVTTHYYSGVPVLFHHALARVRFQVKAAYLQKTADTGDKTKWEITVNSASVQGVHTTGDLTLTLADGAWKLPEPKVWTPAQATKDIPFETRDLTVLTAEPQALGAAQLVLPQTLGEQKVTLDVTIKTYRDTGNGFQLFLTESNVVLTSRLALKDLPQWGINQDITYTLAIAPVRSDGSNPSDPGKPVDPDDPDLRDAVITFDPAVVDWEVVSLNATISL